MSIGISATNYHFSASPENYLVVVGSNKITSGGIPYNVSRIKVHQSYNPRQIINDVAVIRLSSKVTYNRRVSAVGLDNGYVGANASAVLSGWGTTSYPGSIPDRLQYINLTTISYSDCRSRHNYPQVS